MRRCEFLEVFTDATGGNPKLQASDYLSRGAFPVVDQGKAEVAGYSDDASLLAKVERPVIVFGDHTRIFKYVDYPFILGADGTKVLRPRNGEDARYLFHYLRSLEIPSAGYSRHYKFLKEVSIALPLPAEQRRIAAILDKADALRVQRRHALAHVDTLALSIFHTMFGDPVSNSKKWPQQKLNSLGLITTGNTPSRAIPENFGDHIEWVKTDNINTPHTVLTSAKEGLSEKGARKARIVHPGSVLITCIAGSPGVIGNVALVDRTVAFNQQINGFSPNSGPSLYWYALLKSMKPLVQKASSGGMKGLVSKSALSAIDTIVAPDAMQTEFAERLTAVERVKSRHESQLVEIDALFTSLQHLAFKGELR